MSADIKIMKKAILITCNESFEDDFIKAFKRQYKDKNGDDGERISIRPKNRIFIGSYDINRLMNSFEDVSTYIQKRKITYSTDFVLMFNINTHENEPDAFDLMGSISKYDFKKADDILVINFKVVVLYENRNYIVELEVLNKNELEIYIQGNMENTDVCKTNEEFMQFYYNTIHLNINEVN